MGRGDGNKGQSLDAANHLQALVRRGWEQWVPRPSRRLCGRTDYPIGMISVAVTTSDPFRRRQTQQQPTIDRSKSAEGRDPCQPGQGVEQ